jgi:myosin-crossreactive antigen
MTRQKSVFDETMAFNKHHVPHTQARLVDRNGHRTDVKLRRLLNEQD